MQFNNAQFERGIAQSQKSLAAFDNKLNTSFKDSRRSMDDLKALSKGLSFDTITDGVNKIAHSFTLMGRIGLQVMDDIAAKAIRTGKQLVSALTIDPVKSGFREYETQIGAIQTILSNTRSKGTTIDDVNRALDELNKYADMTIYNFTEMTRNIGTFTAAGVDLDTSVSAIKGISNLAAISGSTSTQAATAMYQLSQALASGTIRLMDWNSVVNAGMGGEVFQDALKETARVHGIAIDDMIKKEGSFRETLQNGWLSSEIMLETLQKFTGDLSKEQILAKGYTEEQAEAIMQLGEDANDAATKVKTFSQLIDTLKEALGSGWTNTWEYIIGDFEEARELWTGVSDVLSGIINNSAEARNELLKEWKDLGGRDDLIRGLKDAFEALWGIVLAVGDAMDAIFPDVTVDTLLKLSEAVRTFGQNLKSTLAYWKVFKGEYETVETTVTVSEPEVLEGNLRRGLSNDNVKKLQERLAELGYDLGKMGADGIFGPKTEAALKAFQEDYDLLVDGIYGKDTHAKLTEVLGIGSGEETIITRTAQYVTQFGEALQLVQRIAKGAFAALHIGFQGLQFGWEVFKRLLGVLSPVAGALLHVGAAIGDCFVNLDKWLQESGIFSDWLSDVEEFLKPAAEWFSELGASILGFFGLAPKAGEMNGQISTFAQLWERISSSVRDLDIWGKLSDAFQRLKEAFSGIAPELKAFWESVKNAFGEKARELFESFVNFIPKAANAIGEFFVGVLEFLDPVIQKIPAVLEAIGGFFTGIWGSVRTFVGRIPDFFGALVEFFSTLFEQLNVAERLKSAFNKVKSFFSTIVTSIREFFSSFTLLPTAFAEGNATDTITEGATRVADGLNHFLDILSNVWGKISSVLSPIISEVNKFFRNAGVGGVLGMIAAGFGGYAVYKLIRAITETVKAFASVGSLFTNLSKFTSSFTTFIDGYWDNYKKANKQPMSKSLLQIAEAVALLAAVVYVIGNMDTGSLIKGGIALGAILTALFLFSWGIGKLGDGATFEMKGFLSLAGAIGVLIAAIAILANMDTGSLIKGGIALAAILFALQKFAKSVSASGKGSLKMQGFFGLATAIGVLIGAIAILGHMDVGTLLKGGVALSGVLLILSMFMKRIGKMSGGATFKMQGFMGLATAIGVLIGAIAILGHMDVGTLLKGGAALAGVLIVLSLFVRSIGKINSSTSSFKLTGFIGIAIALGALVAAVKVLGGMDWDDLAKGVLGAGALLVALSTVSKSASGMGIKSGIASILSAVGLIGAMVAFGYVANSLSSVSWETMAAFAGGMSAMMLSLAALTLVSNPASTISALLGLVGLFAVIALVIAAAGAVASNPAAKQFAMGGAEFIGELIGKIVEATTAASYRGMAKGLEALSGANIDQSKVNNAVESLRLISELSQGMGNYTIEEAAAVFIAGTPFQNFCDALPSFAAGVREVAAATSDLPENLGENVATAVDAASKIKELADGFAPALSIPDSFSNLLAGGSPFENFCKAMPIFATGIWQVGNSVSSLPEGIVDNTQTAVNAASAIKALADGFAPALDLGDTISNLIAGETPFENFCAAMPGFATSIWEVGNSLSSLPEGLEDNVTTATTAAQKIADLSNSLDDITISDVVAGMFGVGSKFETFCTDMGTFAETVSTMSTDLSGLPKDLPEKAQLAVDIATPIADLSNTFGSMTALDFAAGLFGVGSPFDTFCSNMGTFSTSVANLQTGLSGISGTDISEDVTTAIDIAGEISRFLEAIPEMNIEGKQGFLDVLFNGQNNTNSLFTQIGNLGTTIQTTAGQLSGLSSGTFVSDFVAALLAVRSIASTITDVGSIENFDSTNLQEVFNQIPEFGAVLGQFIIDADGADLTQVSTVVRAISTLTSALATASTSVNAEAISGFRQALTDLFSVFSGGEDGGGLASSLNSEQITAAIDSFSTTVSTALATAVTTISGYSTQFTMAGSSLMNSLSAGMIAVDVASSVRTILSSARNAAGEYVSRFKTVGYNISSGMASGIRSGSSLVSSAARTVAKNAYNSAMAELDENSPSKKFRDIGMWADQGLAGGLENYSRVVEKAAKGVGATAYSETSKSISSFSAVFSDNVEADPVIRPVVDLSGVTSGARAINGILPGSRSISVAASARRAQETAAGISSRSGQNGVVSGILNPNETMQNGGVNVSGNFYFNNNQDVRALASEIAVLTRNQQRGVGG